MSRTGIFSFRNSSAVPPVEIMSTPCASSARANAAMPVLSETEMRAREIFIRRNRMLRHSERSRGNPFPKRGAIPRASSSWPSSAQDDADCTSMIEDHILCRGIEHRTATNRLAKCLAEMAQARISDFCRRFGDVVATSAQEFGRAFHSEVPQILRNSESNFARKNPTQIKRTAAHFLANDLQRWRIREIASKQLFSALNALT